MPRPRDAGDVATYRITYEGPASQALQAATELADADGIDLSASLPPERRDDESDAVMLVVIVEATPGAMADAARAVGAKLSGATLTVDPNPEDEGPSA